MLICLSKWDLFIRLMRSCRQHEKHNINIIPQVVKEMKIALPSMIISAGLGIILIFTNSFINQLGRMQLPELLDFLSSLSFVEDIRDCAGYFNACSNRHTFLSFKTIQFITAAIIDCPHYVIARSLRRGNLRVCKRDSWNIQIPDLLNGLLAFRCYSDGL